MGFVNKTSDYRNKTDNPNPGCDHKEQSNRELFIRALEGRGKVYDLIGMFPQAEQDYLLMIDSHDNPIIHVHAQLGLALVCLKKGDFGAALARAGKALMHAKKSADKVDHIRGLLVKAQILLRLGDFAEALRYTLQANRFARKQTGDAYTTPRAKQLDYEKTRTIMQLGLVYALQGRYSKAIPLLKRSVVMFGKHGDTWNIAAVNLNLGNIHNEIGNFHRALHYYDIALKIRKRIGDRYCIVNVLHNTSRALSMLGKHKLALAKTQEALQISMQLEDISGKASGYLAKGIHCRNLGLLKEAVAAYRKSLYFCGRTNEPYIRTACLVNMVQLNIALGNLAECEDNITEIETAARQLKNPYILVNALNLKADFYRHAGQLRKTYAALKQSINMCRRCNLVPEEIYALSLFVRVITQYRKCRASMIKRAGEMLDRGQSLTRKLMSYDVLVNILPAQIEFEIAVGRYTKAEKHSRRLLNLLRRSGNRFVLPHAFFYLARVYKYTNRNPSKFLHESRRLARAESMKPLLRDIDVLAHKI